MGFLGRARSSHHPLASITLAKPVAPTHGEAGGTHSRRSQWHPLTAKPVAPTHGEAGGTHSRFGLARDNQLVGLQRDLFQCHLAMIELREAIG